MDFGLDALHRGLLGSGSEFNFTKPFNKSPRICADRSLRFRLRATTGPLMNGCSHFRSNCNFARIAGRHEARRVMEVIDHVMTISICVLWSATSNASECAITNERHDRIKLVNGLFRQDRL